MAGLEDRLAVSAPGVYAVELGTKFAVPDIEEGVGALARRGVDSVIGLVLTPHRSTMGSDDYHRRAADALAALAPAVAYRPVRQFFDAAGFPELLAVLVHEAIGRLAPAARDDAVVVFTAHSLPARVLAEGDPFSDQLAASATSIAAAAGIATWRLAFQSAGRTPEPWLGPALLDVLREEAAHGRAGAVVCPVGFVADHLEVLYDLDIEARGVAEEAGLAFARTRSLNADPRFLDILARVVLDADGPGVVRGAGPGT